jgi:DNA repair protein RecO (recombination protein O)
MLHSTRGIVLHTIKFSETSLIAKIYTELFGVQSYLIKGIRKQKAKIRPTLLQHLTLVDLIVYHKEKNSLQTIKEIQIAFPYKSIPFDIRKSSLALFINELLYKSIREEEANRKLFDFIWGSCIYLDETTRSTNYFHLWFIVHLTAYLGFIPQMNYSEQKKIFNMKEGVFQETPPGHEYFMDELSSAFFYKLFSLTSEEDSLLSFPLEERNLMVEKILLFYRLHLSGFTGLRSHHILHTVLE